MLDLTYKAIAIASLLLSLGATFYAWLTSQGSRALKRAQANADALDQVERRVSRIEGEIKHMADENSMHELKQLITTLQGEIHVLTERIKPVAATQERFQEWLMQQPKG